MVHLINMFMKKFNRQKGFTIVELLIVIVVIGILAAITIVSYSGIQQRARLSTATSEISQLNKAILTARINQGKTLMQITGSGNTCAAASRYEPTIDKISEASGMNLSALKKGTPWGGLYCIDENEGEFDTTDCRLDIVRVNGQPITITIPSYTAYCSSL